MPSPPGWAEPGQRPEFDEFTIVLQETLDREDPPTASWRHKPAQERIPGRANGLQASGVEYISVCVPLSSLPQSNRDD
jgi:hypothetical protein